MCINENIIKGYAYVGYKNLLEHNIFCTIANRPVARYYSNYIILDKLSIRFLIL